MTEIKRRGRPKGSKNKLPRSGRLRRAGYDQPRNPFTDDGLRFVVLDEHTGRTVTKPATRVVTMQARDALEPIASLPGGGYRYLVRHAPGHGLVHLRLETE